MEASAATMTSKGEEKNNFSSRPSHKSKIIVKMWNHYYVNMLVCSMYYIHIYTSWNFFPLSGNCLPTCTFLVLKKGPRDLERQQWKKEGEEEGTGSETEEVASHFFANLQPTPFFAVGFLLSHRLFSFFFLLFARGNLDIFPFASLRYFDLVVGGVFKFKCSLDTFTGMY